MWSYRGLPPARTPLVSAAAAWHSTWLTPGSTCATASRSASFLLEKLLKPMARALPVSYSFSIAAQVAGGGGLSRQASERTGRERERKNAREEERSAQADWILTVKKDKVGVIPSLQVFVK